MTKAPRKPKEEASISSQMRQCGGSIVERWNHGLISRVAAAFYIGERGVGGTRPNIVTMDEIQVVKAGLAALAPADEIEGMLAAQVVTLHGGVLDALRRAAHPTDDDVATMWTSAANLGRVMLDTLAVLDQRQAVRRSQHAPEPEAHAAPVSADDQPAPPPPMQAAKPMTSEALAEKHAAANPAKPVTADQLLSNEALGAYGYRTRGPVVVTDDAPAPEASAT